MPSRMLVHDSRVEGRPPRIAPNTYTVGPQTRIVRAFEWIATYARRHNGLEDLYILAHGRGRPISDPDARMSRISPGFGLIFCRENLTLSNVQITSVLNGLVEVICLFACGPAHTPRGYINRSGDGDLFCRQLAAYTGAVVVAPVDNQIYTMGPNNVIELGQWEGRVRRFEPSGQTSRFNW